MRCSFVFLSTDTDISFWYLTRHQLGVTVTTVKAKKWRYKQYYQMLFYWKLSILTITTLWKFKKSCWRLTTRCRFKKKRQKINNPSSTFLKSVLCYLAIAKWLVLVRGCTIEQMNGEWEVICTTSSGSFLRTSNTSTSTILFCTTAVAQLLYPYLIGIRC